MKLLIIEDEEDLVNLLAKGLRSLGYVIDISTDGREGLELFSINDYDLVVLDINLPSMDGRLILDEIRKENEECKVIILSALSDYKQRIGAFLIYYILKKEFSSLKKLSDEMTLINENKLSHKITGFDNGDELTLFANSFNTMLSRLDKAFESQKRFSVDASHELKTPLTVLKTNLDVLNLIENPSEEDYKYTISIFKKQTERMIDLVDSLFLTAFQKDYDLNDTIIIDNIISNVILDLDEKIIKKNISIDVTKSNIVTKGNRIMLTHAISNVVRNAVNYNKINGNIYITFEKMEKNYIIKIADTGIGIPKDKANLIFEPFFRVDESRSRKSSGAGLGLAITKEVIYRHGGKVSYIPNKDGGSIFEITLPFVV